MLSNYFPDFSSRWGPIIAGVLVCPPWVWFAVRTQNCLRTITRRTVPFPTRTIWLLKILAIIVGAGNVGGVLSDVGLPWPFAVVAAGAVVFVALRENVTDIVPAPPPQTVPAYQPSWQEYRRLRKNAKCSLIAFVVLPVGFAIVMRAVEARLSEGAQAFLSVGFVGTWLASGGVANYYNWKLQRWVCPRCGRFFRGFWGRPWTPKHCVYCDLPLWTEGPEDAQRS
jgi:hypothetical protein